ncbi:MAG: hypothetical protein C0483_09990 [Pirellula sp.]|nr:hypothetical protein [Pirellula sp.]
MLAVGYWTITRFGALMHDREPEAAAALDTPPASKPEPTDTADALMAASLSGRWEFVEAGWTLAVGSATNTAIPAFFSRPLPTTVAADVVVGDWERTVMELVRNFKLVGTMQGSRRVYRFDSPTLRAEIAATTGDAQERLLTARAVFQLAPDQWSTIETARSDESNLLPAGESLLPYPEHLELLAVRRDGTHRVIGQFSRCQEKMAALLQFWRTAGSPVTLKTAYDASDFSEGFCEHRGRLLRVIMWEPRLQGVTTVLVLDASAADVPPLNNTQKFAP